MPPWLPERGHGDFVDARELTEADIATIRRWADRGAPRGAAADLPLPPQWSDEWQLGTPDLVVTAPDAFQLTPGAGDVFRSFTLPVPLDRARWIRGIEIRPGSARAVHHASLSVDRTPGSRELDAADPSPGFDGAMLSPDAQSPGSRALGWTPGMRAAFEPEGMAWRLDAGSDLVIELHLIAPASEVEPITPSVGLYFSAGAPTRQSMDLKIGVNDLEIPAGAASVTAQADVTLPVDVDVLSIYPHAHYLARDVRAFATQPDGQIVSLIWIKNWDFHWQDQYRYRQPVPLPRGTVITMRYTYDNSAGNPRNPASPPKAVVYGPRASDEMGDLWLRLVPRTPADAVALAETYRDNERRKMLALHERMVEREPRSARWRAALGRSYLESGRVRDAIDQLTAALDLEPGRVSTTGNLAEALRRQGRMRDSIGRFREALAGEPDNLTLQIGLANAFVDNGDLTEAIAAFQRILARRPETVDARLNLGVALGALERFDEAEAEFRRVLVIAPGNADAERNLQMISALRRR
jgi:Flp pilus assembly protein TadD